MKFLPNISLKPQRILIMLTCMIVLSITWIPNQAAKAMWGKTADFAIRPLAAQLTTKATISTLDDAFTTLVPSTDGSDLYVKITNINGLQDELFVNLAIGPSSRQPSYTTYASTFDPNIYGYVTTATGFTPSSDVEGNLYLTTTQTINTSQINYNRFYAEIGKFGKFETQDAGLQLNIVYSNTFTIDTYIAVALNNNLPGTLPAGYTQRQVAYTLAASGSVITTSAVLQLGIVYDKELLTNNDFVILAWQPLTKSWQPLETSINTRDQIANTNINQFTTYVLATIPTVPDANAKNVWQDNFDNFSKIDTSQSSNIDILALDNQLTLSFLQTQGSAISIPITPSQPFTTWQTLIYSFMSEPPTTTLTIDLLDSSGNLLYNNLQNGSDLSLLDASRYPALRLRANLVSIQNTKTPILNSWALTWQPIEASAPPTLTTSIYLPFVTQTE